MEELVISQVSEETLQDFTYRGLTFYNYQALSPESRQQLYDGHFAGLQAQLETVPRIEDEGELRPNGDSPEWKQYLGLIGTTGRLEQFRTWDRDGLPDRDMTRREVMQQIREYVEIMQQRDAKFGAIQEDYEELTEEDKSTIDNLFEYFYLHRDPTERTGIEDSSLFDFLGFAQTDVDSLLENNVLEEVEAGSFAIGGRAYLLTQSYQNYWLAAYFESYKPDVK